MAAGDAQKEMRYDSTVHDKAHFTKEEIMRIETLLCNHGNKTLDKLHADYGGLIGELCQAHGTTVQEAQQAGDVYQPHMHAVEDGPAFERLVKDSSAAAAQTEGSWQDPGEDEEPEEQDYA